jgi:APA family basic amino acid/polyamine antiporter
LLATLAILVAALLHALKLRPGAWLQNAAVALKLICIVGLCVLAVFSGPWLGLAEVVDRADAVPPFSISAFALSLLWISYSYLGFNAAVYLAGEVPAAQTQVPKALLLGTSLTLVLYVALNAVFVLVPSYDTVAGREDVATAVAEALGGDWLATAVRGLVALALFTSISAMLMIGPRVYARMAADRLAPQFLNFKGETPTAAIFTQAALAAGVVWLTDLRQLLSYLGFTLGLSAATAVASLFVIARRKPERIGSLPGYPWAPGIFVAFTLLFAGLAATQNPTELLAALVTILSGLLLYTVLRRIYD